MKVALLLMFSLIQILTFGQNTELWGITETGFDEGSIYKINKDGNFQYQKGFIKVSGTNPQGSLLKATDGIFYGVTSLGGSYYNGVIFKYNATNDSYTKLYDFQSNEGRYPNSGLVQVDSETLYGLAGSGGENNDGVIFSFNIQTNTYTKLYDFTAADGADPEAALTLGTDGLLYGVTTIGGVNNEGAIFSFDPSNNTYTKLHDFDGSNGSTPYSALLEYSDGKFYGITYDGGTNDYGVIFSYDPSTATYSMEAKFFGFNGENSYAPLTLGNDGLLYGATLSGGSNDDGTIFSFDPASGNIDKLYDLARETGSSVRGEIVQGTNNKFYGTMHVGGANGRGVIFSFDAVTKTYENLYDLEASVDGGQPSCGLVFGDNNTLYGTAKYTGGRNGTLFKYTIAEDQFTKIFDFYDNDGAKPKSSLITASNGLFYGTTSDGGSDDQGTLYSYDTLTNTITTLVDFVGDNGGYVSNNGLIKHSNGLLYGLTYGGGENRDGVIYSYNIYEDSLTVLHSFESQEGENPIGSLVEYNGILYGVTIYGGMEDEGTIFSFDPVTNTFTSLYSFDDYQTDDGDTPISGLLLADNGVFYGLTNYGGAESRGVLYSYDLAAGYTKLVDFGNVKGSYPAGELIQAQDGLLYGVAEIDGANREGTLYSFNTTDNTFLVVHDFDGANGTEPKGTVLQAKNGLLYGTTAEGGDYNKGVIYTYDILSSTFTKIHDFDDINGREPRNQLLEVEICTSPVLSLDEAALPVLTGVCEIAEPVLPTATTSCGEKVIGVSDVIFPISNTTIDQVTWTFTTRAGLTQIQVQDILWNSLDMSISVSDNVLTLNQGEGSYQWLSCEGDSLVGETNQSYTVKNSGSYYVVVEKDGCSVLSECEEVVITSLTDVHGNSLQAYPNPTSSTLVLKSNISSIIQVISSDGDILKTIPYSNKIDVSDLERGIYYIKQDAQVIRFVKH